MRVMAIGITEIMTIITRPMGADVFVNLRLIGG